MMVSSTRPSESYTFPAVSSLAETNRTEMNHECKGPEVRDLFILQAKLTVLVLD
jgi:hypothetical protein